MADGPYSKYSNQLTHLTYYSKYSKQQHAFNMILLVLSACKLILGGTNLNNHNLRCTITINYYVKTEMFTSYNDFSTIRYVCSQICSSSEKFHCVKYLNL
jgi:hypothetical protein